jgi:hypothetical protein
LRPPDDAAFYVLYEWPIHPPLENCTRSDRCSGGLASPTLVCAWYFAVATSGHAIISMRRNCSIYFWLKIWCYSICGTFCSTSWSLKR